MSFTIQNFDSPEDIITQRGKEYFTSGAVTSLEDVGDGEWIATVSGTEDYDVEIALKKNAIEYTDCTCPYFAENDDCKHVAAVLYSIRERAFPKTKEATPKPSKDKKEKKESTKPKSPFQELQAIAEIADPKDMRDFIRSYASHNKDFTSKFLFHFKHLKITNEASEDGYKGLVALAIKSSTQNDHGYRFIDDRILYKHLKPLNDQIKKHLKDKNYLEATYIIKALIGELAMIEDIASGSSKLSDILGQCFEYLQSIATADVSNMFKDDLFEYCIKTSEDTAYINANIDTDFNAVLNLLANDNSRKTTLLLSLDRKIASLTPKNEESIHYQVLNKRLRYLNAKINLLNQMKRTDEARQVIKDNLFYHDEFRDQAIKEAITDKQYDYAKKLIQDKINGKSVKISGLWTNMRQGKYNEYLLDIAVAENNTKDTTRFALGLFLSSGDMRYYRIAKKQRSAEDWKIEINSLLKKVKSGYGSFDTFLKIFKEENMIDELWGIVKKEPSPYYLSASVKILLPKYREEVISLYKKALNYAARDASNSTYTDIRNHLNLLASIGEIETAKELISEYKIIYKNRRNFMDELSKVRI